MKNIPGLVMKLAVMGAVMPLVQSVAAVKSEKPNVLMLVVDDWGYYDMSLTGSKLYETKNVDKLAEVSTNFTQGYVAYPRSVPSRYSLMSGRHCSRPEGKISIDTRHITKDDYCIAMPFKQAGYQTFFIGKWHLTDGKTMPEDKGFDINIGGGSAGAVGSHFAPFNLDKGYSKDHPVKGMEDAMPHEYMTDYMGRKTVDYINSASKSDKPFLQYVAFMLYILH